MTVTVIIPTYNGAHKILTPLRGLEQQTIPADEVVVVIDGSTDNTTELLKREHFNFKSFRTITQENKGRGEVRNRGAGEASGDLLVFLDDDMLPEEGWLAAHIAHHSKHPGTILTSAAVDPADISKNDFQKFKAMLSLKWKGELMEHHQKPFPKDKAFITAANFSVSKHNFEKIGGFSSALNDVEDYDFAMRASLQNIPIYYDDNASAWHMELASCAHSIRRMSSYRKAHKQLLQLNPELYAERMKNRELKAGKLKKALFRVFRSKFWVKTIDQNYWTWLPQSLRFKLYDVVLTAHTAF